MKIYKSKIDWWLGLPLLYPIFRSIVAMIEGEWLGYLGMALIVLVVLFVSKTTRYIIDENQLTVKSMWIVNNKIDISKIRKVEKSSSVLSSPALSLDRILIRFNKFDEVYISPSEKQSFVKDLLEVNPDIETKL